MKIVDFHTHIGRVRSFSPKVIGWIYANLESLLEYMDVVGVDWAVVLSVPHAEDPFSRLISNEKLLRIAERAGGRLVPFCSLDPRAPDAYRHLKWLLRRGCRGIGEVKVGLRLDDERMKVLYDVAEEEEVPILMHIENTAMGKYCYGIENFGKILKEYRQVRFIAHGPGWWAHIQANPPGNAYPKGEIREEGLTPKLLREFKNLYADISATSGLNALTRDPEFARRFVEEFQDQIVYGTDFPCMGESSQYGPNRLHLEALNSLGVKERVLEKILWGNAEQMLG